MMTIMVGRRNIFFHGRTNVCLYYKYIFTLIDLCSYKICNTNTDISIVTQFPWRQLLLYRKPTHIARIRFRCKNCTIVGPFTFCLAVVYVQYCTLQRRYPLYWYTTGLITVLLNPSHILYQDIEISPAIWQDKSPSYNNTFTSTHLYTWIVRVQVFK